MKSQAFVTTFMDFEGIVLSEISQIEKDEVCFHLCVEFKKRTNITNQKWTHKERTSC